MEQNSIEPTAPEQGAAAPSEAPRRRSRRASAAVGEAVEIAPVVGAPVVDVPADAAPSESDAAPSERDAVSSETDVAEAAPKKRVSRSRKKTEAVSEDIPAAADVAPATDTPAADAAATGDAEPAEAPATKPSRSRSSRSKATAAASEVDGEAAETGIDGAAEHADESAAPRKRSTRGRSRKSAEASEGDDHSSQAEKSESEKFETEKPETSDAAQETAKTEKNEKPQKRGGSRKAEKSERGDSTEHGDSTERGNSPERSEKSEKAEKPEEASSDASENGNDNGGDNGRDDHGRNDNGRNGNGRESQSRSSRTRQRERKRRGQGDDLEPEITEDDVLLPIAGILDVLDNYAFVRTSGYLPGTNDVYVSLGQVKKYGLRKGDAVVGAIRQPREGEGGGRQKYNAIVRVDTVNSRPAEENEARSEFSAFTPIHPNERLRLETESGNLSQRIIDLFAPIGKGQRGLIVGPHESGKSTALRQIAAAVAANQPDAHLMLVLIDERPEDVTELQRTVNGEVIASTFDRGAEDHVTLAELAVERAKRLVELGHDVVLLIDSLTSLARAYNVLAPAASRHPAGSLDAAALQPIKRMLGAARNIENGGSLTVIATASAQPGSRVDEAVIGELEATSNMQLRLSGEAADRRVFPAVELRASATRRSDLLTSPAEVAVMDRLRRNLVERSAEQALESVLSQLGGTSSNVEFLALVQREQSTRA